MTIYIFRKIDLETCKELKAWTKVFQSKEELIDFMTEKTICLISPNYKIEITSYEVQGDK